MDIKDLQCCWNNEISGIARHFASQGYAVYALDHPGFGLSDGLHGYISNFDELVDNVTEQYMKIKGVNCKICLRKQSRSFQLL